MTKNDLYPEKVPLRDVPFVTKSILDAYSEGGAKPVPFEILDVLASRKILMNNPPTKLELQKDEVGYFIRVVSDYRLVK